MNEVVKEWLDKAEGDFLMATREIKVTDRPNYDAVCFHAQQSVEKLMKAVLVLLGQQPAAHARSCSPERADALGYPRLVMAVAGSAPAGPGSSGVQVSRRVGDEVALLA